MGMKDIERAVKRADDQALKRNVEDCYIVICEAGIALHRNGWGSKRINDFLDVVQEVEDECSADPNRSMVQILDEETGIELKPDSNSRGWRELAYLNADVKVEFKTVPQYTYMRSQQIKWIKTNFYANVFLALHRKYGWGAGRMTKLLDQMHEIDKDIHSSAQARRLYRKEIGEDLQILSCD